MNMVTVLGCIGKLHFFHFLTSSLFLRAPDPSLHPRSGTHLAPGSKDLRLATDTMTHSSLLDPTAVCHHPDLTGIHDQAFTILHLGRMVHLCQMYLFLLMGLHYQPTDTQVCPCLDRWEILALAPTDMRSTPDQVLAMSLILEVYHHHTSVPRRLITLGR